jgi:hypothetical protein
MGYSMGRGLCLYQDKALRKDFLGIIYLSRFTKSSLPFPLQFLRKCDPEPFTKTCQTNWKPSRKESIREVWMEVAEK